MNQDQVKKQLLEIEDAPEEFTVTFTGKKSKRVNGLYRPETREILIHNKNFVNDKGEINDNLLFYTAIHEYAHHLHACRRGGRLSPRAHTAEFWAILHELLEKAEKKSLYRNVFESSPELIELTDEIREKYLKEHGSMVKELGAELLKAHELCTAAGGRWEDYVDRVLRIPRQAANLAVRMYQYNLDPQTGPDNMRFLAGISNAEKREEAQAELIKGRSPDMVKVAVRKKDEEPDPRGRLEKEKQRLERTVASLTKRIEEIDRELEAE
jgi:hypothetical protein